MRVPSATTVLTIILLCSWTWFLAGCPRDQVDEVGLPTKSVQEPVSGWEYCEMATAPEKLNEAGRGGWEAYAVVAEGGIPRTVYLKRPIH